MAAKTRTASADKDLKKTLKKLRSQLDRADARADKWRKKAVQLEKSAAKSQAEVKKLTKRLDKASRTGRQSSADDSSSPTVAPIPAVAADAPDTAESDGGPSSDWTVVQLRAEARSRGLTGLSGKSKAQLLEALS